MVAAIAATAAAVAKLTAAGVARIEVLIGPLSIAVRTCAAFPALQVRVRRVRVVGLEDRLNG
jgi:hypothetical protein